MINVSCQFMTLKAQNILTINHLENNLSLMKWMIKLRSCYKRISWNPVQIFFGGNCCVWLREPFASALQRSCVSPTNGCTSFYTRCCCLRERGLNLCLAYCSFQFKTLLVLRKHNDESWMYLTQLSWLIMLLQQQNLDTSGWQLNDLWMRLNSWLIFLREVAFCCFKFKELLLTSCAVTRNLSQ